MIRVHNSAICRREGGRVGGWINKFNAAVKKTWPNARFVACLEAFGPPNKVHWFQDFDSLAQFEEFQKSMKVEGDLLEAWRESYDLFVPETFQVEVLRSVD